MLTEIQKRVVLSWIDLLVGLEGINEATLVKVIKERYSYLSVEDCVIIAREWMKRGSA